MICVFRYTHRWCGLNSFWMCIEPSKAEQRRQVSFEMYPFLPNRILHNHGFIYTSFKTLTTWPSVIVHWGNEKQTLSSREGDALQSWVPIPQSHWWQTHKNPASPDYWHPWDQSFICIENNWWGNHSLGRQSSQCLHFQNESGQQARAAGAAKTVSSLQSMRWSRASESTNSIRGAKNILGKTASANSCRGPGRRDAAVASPFQP